VRYIKLTTMVFLLFQFFGCDKNKCEPVEYLVDENQLALDIAEIDQHLIDTGITAMIHESGIRYLIHEEGIGGLIQPCMRVSVHYAGYLLDGTCFDTSIEQVAINEGTYDSRNPYSPFTFFIDQGGVISGWPIGIKLLKEGSKATLYIPSVLAYGESGAGNDIPANAQLIFYVEIVKVVVP